MPLWAWRSAHSDRYVMLCGGLYDQCRWHVEVEAAEEDCQPCEHPRQVRCRVHSAEPRALSCLHSACTQVTRVVKSPVAASNCHSSLHGMSCVGLHTWITPAPAHDEANCRGSVSKRNKILIDDPVLVGRACIRGHTVHSKVRHGVVRSIKNMAAFSRTDVPFRTDNRVRGVCFRYHVRKACNAHAVAVELTKQHGTIMRKHLQHDRFVDI